MGHARRQGMENETSGLHPQIIEADRLLRAKNYQEAAKLYAACQENEPGHAEALKKLGFCLLKMNKTAEARQAWDTLHKIKPGDHFAALYTGLSHAMDDNVQEAVSAWKSYFNIKHPLIQREINLILALHERGDQLDPADLVKSVEEAIAAQLASQR
jgi:tetratricopeptide (TPR) repeat protein